MKTTNENGRLTVFLDGRIDTNNAAEVEKEIFDAIAEGGADYGVALEIEVAQWNRQ